MKNMVLSKLLFLGLTFGIPFIANAENIYTCGYDVICGDTYVLKSNKKPITGKVIDFYRYPTLNPSESVKVIQLPDGLYHVISMEVEVKNGRADGMLKEYRENGQLSVEENYEDGIQQGMKTTYYENGQKNIEVLLKDGEIEGIAKKYNEEGKLIGEISYKNGKRDGLSKTYHNNGQLAMEENHIDGKENGMVKLYYENGKLNAEYNWQDGELQGINKVYLYDENQNVRVLERTYENGIRIK